jgi:hypothetical protein
MASSTATKSYQIPAFIVCPSSATVSIVYSDVTTGGLPSWVTFTPATRTYDWSTATQAGSTTIIMQGVFSGTFLTT